MLVCTIPSKADEEDWLLSLTSCMKNADPVTSPSELLIFPVMWIFRAPH